MSSNDHILDANQFIPQKENIMTMMTVVTSIR